MTHRSMHISRRQILTSTAAFAAFGGTEAQAQMSTVSLANRLSDLAGADVLPRDLLENLQRALDVEDRTVLASQSALPDGLRNRVLEGLYTGVLPALEDGGTGTRIAFSTALMWSTIDRTNNVISYCGGIPHFWADPPQAA